MVPEKEISFEKAPEIQNSFVSNSLELNRSCYSLVYDYRTRNPLCVYECLTQEGLKGD